MIFAAMLSGTSAASAQFDYHIIVLDPPRGTSLPGTKAFGINDAGEVIGAVTGTTSDNQRAFVWLPADRFDITAGIHELSSVISGAPTDEARARAINNDGKIVGMAKTSAKLAYLWDLATNTHMAIPDALAPSEAHAINNEAIPTVVGEYTPVSFVRGFRWMYGDQAIEELMTAGQRPSSYAYAVHGNGLAVGGSDWEFLLCDTCGAGTQDDICVLGSYWPNTTNNPQPLTTLGDGDSVGRGINDLEHVVGSSKEAPPGGGICFNRAVFWSEPDITASPLRLPFVPDGNGIPAEQGYLANAVSNVLADGQIRVVGTSEALLAAALWHVPANEVDTLSSWQVANLNSLSIRGDCSLDQLVEATDINDDGWIVGWGFRPGSIVPHAFILIPFNGIEGDLVGDAGSSIPNGCVDVLDLLYLLGQWDQDDCLADINQDGIVNVNDMLIVLGDWSPTCPGGTMTLEEAVLDAGLTMEDWDDFVDVMAGEDDREKDIWLCWMTNYLTKCQSCPTCIGSDPFAQ